jgi:hypothetical protein
VGVVLRRPECVQPPLMLFFNVNCWGVCLEARGGIEPPIKVLQTFALPLGDRASVQTHTTRVEAGIAFLERPAMPAFPA